MNLSFSFTKRVLAGMALVDVLVFGGWIAREEVARAGDAIELPVQGYDPRDLLSGHYVRFRLVAEREAYDLVRPGASASELGSPSGSGERVSVCLERGGDGLYHVARLRAPGEACTFLTGTVEPYRVDFGVERFYVDERRANDVGWVGEGPKTYLVATTDAAGRVHPLDLVVDGKSLAPSR